MTTAQAIFILGLLFMAVGLMAVGYMFKRQALVFGAVGAWMLLAGYSFTISVAVWDIYYTLGWFSIGLVFVSAIESMFVREKPEPPVEKDSLDELVEKQEKYDGKVERIERAMKINRGRRKPPAGSKEE